VFTTEERDDLRETLIALARADNRITAAAVTGSAATGRQDQWSDIDLAFSVSAEADFNQTLADWTDRMYHDHGALHHLDVPRGATVYRVFLLVSTLQVDLAFSPADEFGAIGPSFHLLFGATNEPRPSAAPKAAQLIGWGWLYALHARSSIARGRLWQAEYMVSGARDQVLALAGRRHGLPTAEARGVDNLPSKFAAQLSGSLVHSLEASELSRAFRVVVKAFIVEIEQVDTGLACTLAKPLRELAGGGTKTE
jgi:hypothetical protein